METILHPITLYWTSSKDEDSCYVSHNRNLVFTVSKNMNFGNPKWNAFVQNSVKGQLTVIYNNGNKMFSTMKDAKLACAKRAEWLAENNSCNKV